MKRLLILLFILPLLLQAQKEFSYEYGLFPDGGTAYLFANDVNIREAPATTARSFGKLKAGTKVKIYSHGILYQVNGVYAQWYEVQAGSVRGWIWGGFLALTAADTGEGLVMYGLTGFSPDSSFYGEVRYMKGGRVISSLPLKPYYTAWDDKQEYDYSVGNTLTPASGLKNIDWVWEIYFLYEACGYSIGPKYVAWNGKDLIYVAGARSWSEAAIAHLEGSVIFPWDEGGKENLVIQRNVSSEWDEKLEDYKITETTEDVLKWDGTRFSMQTH